jgi:hypothetical protein
MRLRARSHAPEIIRLTIQTAAESDYRSKSGALTKMSFFLDIAQGNTGGLCWYDVSANALVPVVFAWFATWAHSRNKTHNACTCVGRCVTISRRFNKTTITELTIMRGLHKEYITLPIAFKAIRESRRAQLWSRQASIIMDLTALAFRQVARKHLNQRY